MKNSFSFSLLIAGILSSQNIYATTDTDHCTNGDIGSTSTQGHKANHFILNRNLFGNLFGNINSESDGLMLVLGQKNISQDHLHILGQQIPRILSRKPLYDTLFLHEEAKDEFENSLDPYQRNTSIYECKSTDEVVANATIKAAKMQKNLSMVDVQLDSYRKVYILGHGKAGFNSISSGESIFTAREVVELLYRNGILDNIKDLRFTSCGSADKREIDSVSKERIAIANQDSTLFERLFYGEPMSFIEVVSSEIRKKGYTDVRVSGYHGAGVFYSGEELPLTHLRSSTVPITDKEKRKNLRVIISAEVDEVD